MLVTPTVGFAGAAGLVPYTTAVEGIRAMAKSAARQWASDDIIVNAITAPLDLFAPALAPLASHLTAAALHDAEGLVESSGRDGEASCCGTIFGIWWERRSSSTAGR